MSFSMSHVLLQVVTNAGNYWDTCDVHLTHFLLLTNLTHTDSSKSTINGKTHLCKSQGTLVQAMACLSRAASDAKVADLNILQAKSHSSTPPKAMALQ